MLRVKMYNKNTIDLFQAHKSTVWLCRHLPQNREIFVTGGGSGGLCLWK